ncbi:MAG TPA: pyridoxal-phosphate dependent enzyme, partial [Candidatus Limnocylindrales bacterium]
MNERLAAALDRLPRLRLAVTPTPLEPLPRLAKHLGVESGLLVKRDDLTGLAFGGNKVRALEYLLGDAVAQGCDVLVAGGGVAQSNHARLCAAASVKAGLRCVLVLRRTQKMRNGGNLLITDLMGAEIVWSDGDPAVTDRAATGGDMLRVAADLTALGHKPYVLPSSVHPLSVLSYLRCALELDRQLGAQPAALFAASEGAVVTGLRLAAALLEKDWEVYGVGWRPMPAGVPERLAALADEAAKLIEYRSPLSPEDFRLLDFGGPAYGEPSAAALESLVDCARLEALLLDPVYTAKGMAGLTATVRSGSLDPDRAVVFVHTGGLPALFAMEEEVR